MILAVLEMLGCPVTTCQTHQRMFDDALCCIIPSQSKSLKDTNKGSFVPLDLAHVMTRSGEWVMLMLGESVCALVAANITPAPQSRNVTVRSILSYLLGFVTLTLLKQLYYGQG